MRYTARVNENADPADAVDVRRHNRWHTRFDQPDPYDGSYDLSDPQSFNRYSYVGGDPVNFIDPSGLMAVAPDQCFGDPNFCGDVAPWAMFMRAVAREFYWGGYFPNPQARNPPVDQQGVKRVIESWLEGDCAKFVSGTLSKVASKNNPLYENGDIMKLFEAVAAEGGFQRGAPPDGLGSLEGGTIRGRIGKDATIYLPGFDSRQKNINHDSDNLLDAGGILHELMHLSTKKPNDDVQLAAAVKAAGYGVNSWPIEKDNRNLAYSSYIHAALQKYCGVP